MVDDFDLKHNFLLAMPNQVGSYFGDTITYICDHGPDGAMGLMINRPSEITLFELLSQLGLDSSHELVEVPVLDGGPVSTDHGFVLHTRDEKFSGSTDLGNNLMLSTARETLEAIAAGHGPEQYLVTLGYAGWGGGQLEAELAENAWLSCPADPAVLFDVPYDQRVSQAAASLGIDFSLMSARAGYA